MGGMGDWENGDMDDMRYILRIYLYGWWRGRGGTGGMEGSGQYNVNFMMGGWEKGEG